MMGSVLQAGNVNMLTTRSLIGLPVFNIVGER